MITIKNLLAIFVSKFLPDFLKDFNESLTKKSVKNLIKNKPLLIDFLNIHKKINIKMIESNKNYFMFKSILTCTIETKIVKSIFNYLVIFQNSDKKTLLNDKILNDYLFIKSKSEYVEINKQKFNKMFIDEKNESHNITLKNHQFLTFEKIEFLNKSSNHLLKIFGLNVLKSYQYSLKLQNEKSAPAKNALTKNAPVKTKTKIKK